MQITAPICDLCSCPDGPRDRQLLLGDRIESLDTQGDWHHIKDTTGYTGFVPTAAIGSEDTPTHIVTARSTQAYVKPDFKSGDTANLSFTAQVRKIGETDRFIQTQLGFIPKQHLSPKGTGFADLASAATVLIGTPYLWGGNSSTGIDCSGLIEAALRATGQKVMARDSGDQEKLIGTPLPMGATYKRNDLLFWKGHVALVTDAETLIHANAHHMSVAFENIQSAIRRIADQGDGPVTAHKRL